MCFLTTAGGASDGFACMFGIAQTTAAAFTAGVASVPTPFTEIGWDGWLFHQIFFLRAGNIIDGSAAADHDIVSSRTAAFNIDVDSKAMRKEDTDKVIYAAIEVTEIGVSAMVAHFDSRLLVKLP